MEVSDRDSNMELGSTPTGQQSGKSKLDLLSKEDLIKFAKKQMVMLQKVKSRCSDLEKELGVLKSGPCTASDDRLIQDLSERMESVLLEKAEGQQSLVLLRRQHEELQKQQQETVERVEALEQQLSSKHQECVDLQQQTSELTLAFQVYRTEHQSSISEGQKELEEARHQWLEETEVLRDAQQMFLTESQQEVENLQQEMEKLQRQYEEDVRYLEEQLEMNASDFERERQHLLLVQDELSEQLALKEGFLQDVQEEEEDPGRPGSVVQNHNSEGSDLPVSEDSDEGNSIKLALEDLRSQNIMIRDEVLFLRNVKVELESELTQMREEFSVEKEEMEFRINELRMNRDELDRKNSERDAQTSREPEETYAIRTLSVGETDLRQFIQRCSVLTEQTSGTVQDLLDKLKSRQDRESLMEQTPDEQNLEGKEDNLVTFEEIRNINEGILLNLQNLETLASELKRLDCRNGMDQETSFPQVFEKQPSTSKVEDADQVEDLATVQKTLKESQDTIGLLKSQLSSLSEEREATQRNMEAEQEHLCRISEVLQQDFPQLEVTSDISISIKQISKMIQEEKLELSRQLEESREQFALKLEDTVEVEDLPTLQKTLKESQDTIDLLKSQLSSLSEEQETTQRNMEAEREHLFRISDVLQQDFPQLEVTSDISISIKQISKMIQEEKLELSRQLEESREQFALKLEDTVQVEDLATLQKTLMESQDTIDLLKSQLSSLSEEREATQQNMEAEREHLCRITEVLQQDFPQLEVSSDISISIKQISKMIQEEKLELSRQLEESREQFALKLEDTVQVEDLATLQKTLKESQDTIDLLKSQLSSLSEEQEITQQNMEAEQEQSMKMIQEEKLELSRQLEESREQFALQLESTRSSAEERTAELQAHILDLEREKELLKASLDDVVLDAEGFLKDLSETQAMNQKLTAENQTLCLQVEEVSRRLDERREDKPDVDEVQEVNEENLALISQLQKEISLLKISAEASVSANVVELSNKIETLNKESKEKDERTNKIKAVAVKAKKELDSSRKQVLTLQEELDVLKAERDQLSRSLKDIIHGAEDYKNLMVDYDKQAELLEQKKHKLDQVEKQNEDLTRRLQNAHQQHEVVCGEREDLTGRVQMLQSSVSQLESQALELQKLKVCVERDLEAEKLLREQKSKEHRSAVQETEELQVQLGKLHQHLQETSQELQLLRKDAQQNSLLDMEMADYEKLLKEMNQKLSEREQRVEELQTHAQTQQETERRLREESDALKLLVDQTEEKACRFKQLLVKTKKDLSDAKQKDAAQMVVQASLRGELEAHQQQLEESKITCSEVTAERHRLQEQLKQVKEQHQKTSGSYQLRVAALQDECSAAQASLTATLAEFDSYKVRVHNVLKQQKNKSAVQSDGDAFKQERDDMEAAMQQLRTRLQETQQNLQSSGLELQQLQTEHDALLERHNRILQESVSKEAELRERLLALQSESLALRSEHGQCAAQLSVQTEALRSSFREQTRHLQDEHSSTLETLQKQMGRLEAQLFQMQKDNISSSTGPVQPSRKSPLERKLADLPQFDLQGMAREEGEGMETTESESRSSVGTPLTPLEQLLSSAEQKHEPVVWPLEPSREELVEKLGSASRSVEHLSRLLHESEATNAVLMEQTTLLKSEVRRLERNQQREKSVANLEYLKNVLLQFIFLRSGSERQALLPVIHTMLQLSPEEKSKLAAIAHGEEESSGSRSSGWTSYLHSWSGIR